MLQSWIRTCWSKLEADFSYYECYFADLTGAEWEHFVAEISTPGKILLPESGPVKAMVVDAFSPYFAGRKNVDECISVLKNQLKLYVSE